MEVRADRPDFPDYPKVLERITLGELVERYRDTMSVKKRGYEVERIVFTAFLRHPICRRPVAQLRTEHFAAYRAERLKTIKPTASTEIHDRLLIGLAHDLAMGLQGALQCEKASHVFVAELPALY